MNGFGGSLSVMANNSCPNYSENCASTFTQKFRSLNVTPLTSRPTEYTNHIFVHTKCHIFQNQTLSPHRLNEMHNVELHKKTFLSLKHFSIRAIILSNTASVIIVKFEAFSLPKRTYFPCDGFLTRSQLYYMTNFRPRMSFRSKNLI